MVATADPTGLETPGLLADLAGYIPDGTEWQQLRSYRTRQSLTISSTRTPTTWPGIVRAAGVRLRPGTTAVTIGGTRHRTGQVGGGTDRINAPVTFTVFLRCTPTATSCQLLRLSELGNPLH